MLPYSGGKQDTSKPMKEEQIPCRPKKLMLPSEPPKKNLLPVETDG